MGRHSCLAKQKLRKGLWSPEEDVKLFNFISKNGVGCWSSIPKQAGLQRCGKSCRLRWLNYLRPDLKRGMFSQHEEEIVINLHKVLGNRWAQIAVHLPGRTDNEIKNFWNSCLKKKLMKQGIDPKTHKRLNIEGINDPNCTARNSTGAAIASDSELQQPEQSNSAAFLDLPTTTPTSKTGFHPTSYCYYNSSSTDHIGLFQSGHAVFNRPVFDATSAALFSSYSSPPLDGFGSLNRSSSGILLSNHQQNIDHLSTQLEQVSNCGLNVPNLSTNAASYLGDRTNFLDSTSTQRRGISSNSLMSLVNEAEESSATCSMANYNLDHTAVALAWENKFKCLLEYSHDRGRHDGIKIEDDLDHKLTPWPQIEQQQIHFTDDHHFRSSGPMFKSFSEDLARLDGDIFLQHI